MAGNNRTEHRSEAFDTNESLDDGMEDEIGISEGRSRSVRQTCQELSEIDRPLFGKGEAKTKRKEKSVGKGKSSKINF